MVLDDIADYLASQGGVGVGVVGTSLFKGYLPEQPDVAVAVYETGGYPPVRAMTSVAGSVVVERPAIQVVVRGASRDYQAPRTRMANAYAVLEGLVDRTVNSTRYLYVAAAHSPFQLTRDEAGRVLLACNFDVWKALSTSTST